MEVGWYGLPALAIGFGFLLGIEMTAAIVEKPFGRQPDDLPLESYCQTAREFVRAVVDSESGDTSTERRLSSPVEHTGLQT